MFRSIALAALLATASLSALAASQAFTVVDDAGRKVSLPHVPQRIVSIAPGATEMLFAAGAGERVIATVEFSNEPAAARTIPRVGDSNAIDIERVVALHPDVVVVWEGGNNVAQVNRLERLGLPLYRHKIEKLADMPIALRRLGALTDTAAAAESAARDIETRIARLQQRYAQHTEQGTGSAGSTRGGPTVLLEVWNRPIYTVGGSHMMTDSLRLCGARNVFADLKEQGPSLDIEAVIARDPDIIVAVAPTGTAAGWLDEWRRFGSLRAVRSGRLIPFEDARLSRLGPSALGGTETLCEVLAEKK